MGLHEEVRTPTLFKRGIDYLSDRSDDDVQIIKEKKSEPRVKGTLFTWTVHNDFGTLILDYSRESGKHGRRKVWGDVLVVCVTHRHNCFLFFRFGSIHTYI